jgi:hypothetical protein
MTVIFDVEVESRRGLLELEKAEILKHIDNPLCLNHNRPVISREEKRQSDVEYGKRRREVNKERERNRVAEWRKNNPKKYAEQVRRSVEQQRIKRRS